MTCEETVMTGPRAGEACGFAVSEAIATAAYTLQVCGYHARAYTADVRYPLTWNLARIRAWQLENVARLVRAGL